MFSNALCKQQSEPVNVLLRQVTSIVNLAFIQLF